MLRVDWQHAQIDACVGDWLEAHGVHGEGVRRGQIVDVLGLPHHLHFQVRWSEDHESMVFPREVLRIIPSTGG